MPIDLKNATPVSPAEVAVAERSPTAIDLKKTAPVAPKEAPILGGLTGAGVTLVKWVLVMISVFTGAALVWIVGVEFMFALQIHELFKAGSPSKELIDPLVTQRTDFRDFWLKIFQMVLLNVLLPVLTALLGYIFGSSKDQAKS